MRPIGCILKSRPVLCSLRWETGVPSFARIMRYDWYVGSLNLSGQRNMASDPGGEPTVTWIGGKSGGSESKDDEVEPGALAGSHSGASIASAAPGAGPGVESSKMRNENDASGSWPSESVRIPASIVHVTVSPITNAASGWKTTVFPSSESRTNPPCEPEADPTAWMTPAVSDEASTHPPGRTMIVVPGMWRVEPGAGET